MIDRAGTALRAKSQCNPLYRQCLKIHQRFLQEADAERAQRRFGGQDEQLELSVYQQVEMLLQILSTEVIERAMKVQAALENYKKCTLQKGFIALLTHMME